MKYQVTFWAMIYFLGAVFLSGCSSTLINERTDSSGLNQPTGVPWVESRRYDVYVFALTDDQGGKIKEKLLHYDHYLLGDKVNGIPIDPQRVVWMTNYRSGPFSDASLEIEFHGNGSLKKLDLSADNKPSQVIETVTVPLNLQDEIKQKELDRLKRRNAIADERAKLDSVDN